MGSPCFDVGMDLLLKMQAWYDTAQMRARANEIAVRRYYRVIGFGYGANPVGPRFGGVGVGFIDRADAPRLPARCGGLFVPVAGVRVVSG